MTEFIITQEYLKELFDYHEGELFWKVQKANRIKIGNKAGSLSGNDYYQIGINGKQYKLHRIIFLYHNGYLPKMIDHIDNNSFNNKIENLRESTRAQNAMNMKSNKNSSSIYKGITWDKQHQKWRSAIKINNKQKYLGLFINEIDAAKAYNKAAIKYYEEFANLNEVK